MGWEDGSAGRERDPDRRAMLMGARLRQAWDPARWDRRTRSAWQTLAVRRGIDPAKPPRVAVIGGVRSMPSPPEGAILTLHRSKPLSDVLRRFNCFSNNDIERVAASIGPVIQLEQLLAAKTAAPPDAVRVETASGLGENRLSPRIVVRMMREFRRSAERLGLGVESLLPVAGCDPGTVTRFFPAFSEGSNATSLVGKTGTLTSTDGGISVLAGFLNTSRGELVFCVAAPRSAGRARAARQAEQRWLLDLLSRSGGAQPRECAPPLGNADDGAEIVLTGASGGSGARAAAVRSGSAVQRSGNVSR
jgi:D-alanyl-D-alanine carboxypeptidase/D-alanyl-D-alanine-endopeptidase (penicillin-binding protein 4)